METPFYQSLQQTSSEVSSPFQLEPSPWDSDELLRRRSLCPAKRRRQLLFVSSNSDSSWNLQSHHFEEIWTQGEVKGKIMTSFFHWNWCCRVKQFKWLHSNVKQQHENTNLRNNINTRFTNELLYENTNGNIINFISIMCPTFFPFPYLSLLHELS